MLGANIPLHLAEFRILATVPLFIPVIVLFSQILSFAVISNLE